MLLDKDETENVFLLDWVEINENANQHSIAILFDGFVNTLAPDFVKKEDVLLFISDADPYMVAAGKDKSIL